jgi:hypothetical protein
MAIRYSVLATGAKPYCREDQVTSLHDPAFGVRRVLWLAYGVLAIALIFFVAAAFMLRDHHFPSIAQQPPAAASPSHGPALTQNTPGSGQPRAQTAGPGGQLTRTGPPGEPPGDIEDDSRGGSGSGSTAIPPANSGGTLPPVSLPSPVVPPPPAAVPSAAPSVLPFVLPSLLPTPAI